MTFVEFLRYAGTGLGINAIVGFVLSFVVDWFPQYEALPARSKRLVMMGLCFVIPVAALVGLVLLGDTGLSVDAVWFALSAGFSAFFGSQVAQARELANDTMYTRGRGMGLQDDIEDVFGSG